MHMTKVSFNNQSPYHNLQGTVRSGSLLLHISNLIFYPLLCSLCTHHSGLLAQNVIDILSPRWSLCSASSWCLKHLLLYLLISFRLFLECHLHEACLRHLHIKCNILHLGFLVPFILLDILSKALSPPNIYVTYLFFIFIVKNISSP